VREVWQADAEAALLLRRLHGAHGARARRLPVSNHTYTLPDADAERLLDALNDQARRLGFFHPTHKDAPNVSRLIKELAEAAHEWPESTEDGLRQILMLPRKEQEK
jgi:hypothetical protein